MSSMVWITVGTAVSVFTPMIAWRIHAERRSRNRYSQKAPAPATHKSQAATQEKTFASVIIEPGLCACDAVAAYARQALLENDAPALPLPGCTEARCQCRFRQLEDRRRDNDRRSFADTTSALRIAAGAVDRRSRDSRRAEKVQVTPRAYFNDY